MGSTRKRGGQTIYKGDKFNMDLVLSKQPDFAAAKSALEEFVSSRGHLLEITGVGIENGWAVAKQEFRCENDFSVKTLSARVQHALTMLTLPVIRNCARRARDYERAYRALDDGSGTELQHKQIEQMKKQVKHHRDALDFSAAWAKAERQAETARRARGGQ